MASYPGFIVTSYFQNKVSLNMMELKRMAVLREYINSCIHIYTERDKSVIT